MSASTDFNDTCRKKTDVNMLRTAKVERRLAAAKEHGSKGKRAGRQRAEWFSDEGQLEDIGGTDSN